MTIIREERIGGQRLILGDCLEVMPLLGEVQAILTDPPFSERTHKGHDAGKGRDGVERKQLGYAALSPNDVQAIGTQMTAICNGWICWITDYSLAPSVMETMQSAGRYVFAPLPFFQPGRSVRLTGDGPCSWTDWIIASRTSAQLKWGTLPGGYVAGEGWKDKERIGGKPMPLMMNMVRDYSRPGDTVCDPFMGSGTTLAAAERMGRCGIGIELDPVIFDIACRRVEEAVRQPDLFIAPPETPTQEKLL